MFTSLAHRGASIADCLPAPSADRVLSRAHVQTALPLNLAKQSGDYTRSGYLKMVQANDETAAILNAGVCNRVGVFNRAYWAEDDAQSLDYAVGYLLSSINL